MDVRGRLQVILRFGAGKILDLQHGAHEQLGKEVLARAKRVPSLLRASSRPGINNSTADRIANPSGAHDVNGSTNGSPAADSRVALGERA